MAKIIEIKVNGEMNLLDVSEDAMLPKLQGIVGGYIETVPINGSGLLMVVNEEGLIREMTINSKASALADQFIFGPAAIVSVGYNEYGELDLVGIDHKEAETDA